jgi:hypothetical protein
MMAKYNYSPTDAQIAAAYEAGNVPEDSASKMAYDAVKSPGDASLDGVYDRPGRVPPPATGTSESFH